MDMVTLKCVPNQLPILTSACSVDEFLVSEDSIDTDDDGPGLFAPTMDDGGLCPPDSSDPNVYAQPYLDAQANIVSIDGDLYLVTIPTVELLRDIVCACRDHLIQFDSDEFAFGSAYRLKMDRDDDSVRRIEIPNTLKALMSWRIHDDLSASILEMNCSKHGLFRPVLIPLKDDMNPDLSLQQENPDGSIVYGGRLEKLSDGFVRFLDSDARSNNLAWMWWGGCLVNLYPRISVSPRIIFEHQLATDILFELYKSRWKN